MLQSTLIFLQVMANWIVPICRSQLSNEIQRLLNSMDKPLPGSNMGAEFCPNLYKAQPSTVESKALFSCHSW
jgi:hypothetical protein